MRLEGRQLLTWHDDGSPCVPNASPAFDMWALGLVVFLLCTGKRLFSVDMAEDELANETERQRVLSFSGLPPSTVGDIFAAAEARDVEDEERAQAYDLLRWLLQPDPSKRPGCRAHAGGTTLKLTAELALRFVVAVAVGRLQERLWYALLWLYLAAPRSLACAGLSPWHPC